MSANLLCMMPFDEGMNLGAAYNRAMELLPEDGWACFLDHDAIWTTRLWFRQIQEAIACRPEAGCFAAMSNRIAAPWQQVGSRDIHDMKHHRRFGLERAKVRTLLDITDTKGFGGVVIVVSKASWRAAGGFPDGMMCVDHGIHFRTVAAGRRNYLIEGLYVYHWRRAFGDGPPRDAPFAKDCPCRGPEPKPTERVSLP